MSTTVAIWRTSMMSLRNATRANRGLQIAFLFAGLMGLALGVWGGWQLWLHLRQWQEQGTMALSTGLWLLCIGTWNGLSFFALLGLSRLVGSDESILLFTLPLSPATHFRALCGAFFIENQWLVGTLQFLITGYVLLAGLGWRGLPWLLMLQLGGVVTIFVYVLVGLLVIRYLLPRGRGKERVVAVLLLVILLALVGVALKFSGPAIQQWFLHLSPVLVGLFFAVLLLLIMGPGAVPLGKLYATTFCVLQEQDRAHKGAVLPGLRWLQGMAERRRSLTGALFAKALANQGRNIFFWVRLVTIWGLLAFFPLLRSWLHGYGFHDTALVIVYASVLTIGHIIETGPSAFGGEGNRLTLYLTAPLAAAQILKAKILVFLLPVLLEGLVMGLLLSCYSGLNALQMLLANGVILLVVGGGTMLLVCGSTWDADINLSIEGLVAMIMYEEGPFTPRRMQLFSLTLLFQALIVLILWRMPLMVALPVLVLLNGGLVYGMWRFGLRRLQRVVV